VSPSAIFCTQCGSSNERGDSFCRNCGERLQVAPPAPPVFDRTSTSRSEQGSAGRGKLPVLLALGAIVLLLSVLAIEAVVLVVPRGAVQEVGATLTVPEGRAFVQGAGNGDWVEVADSFVVQREDRIRVADESQAVLTFVDGTSTELRSLTELKVTESQLGEGGPAVIRLDLQLGEVWNRIAGLPAGSLHEITTNAMRAACRDGEYGIAVDEAGTTWLSGHEGQIDVSAAGEVVQLGPGDTLEVEPGSPPAPYVAQAGVPTESDIPACDTLGGVDLPTFLNAPVPTSTPSPTRPATHTPTPTRTSTPTATATRVSCVAPTLLDPYEGSAIRLGRAFDLSWDWAGTLSPGWAFVIEFIDPYGGVQRVPEWFFETHARVHAPAAPEGRRSSTSVPLARRG
jgi:hypothetical protein